MKKGLLIAFVVGLAGAGPVAARPAPHASLSLMRMTGSPHAGRPFTGLVVLRAGAPSDGVEAWSVACPASTVRTRLRPTLQAVYSQANVELPIGYLCAWNVPRRSAGLSLTTPVEATITYASGVTQEGRLLGSLTWKIKP